MHPFPGNAGAIATRTAHSLTKTPVRARAHVRAGVGAVLMACVALLGCTSKSDAPPAPVTETPAATTPEVEKGLPEVLGVPALEDMNPDPNVVEVNLTAQKVTLDVNGKPVEMLGYNGMVPGPMLKAKVGDEIIVHFRNDTSKPTTIHWHGLRIPDLMDGSPRLQNPIKPGEEFEYRFKVPDAGTYWYHPHVRAHEQVEAGLYAPIVIFDPAIEPEYDAERYLLVDDLYLQNGKRPPEFVDFFEVMHGRLGDIMLTNGLVSKTVVVDTTQGTVERWRLVNTSNARTFQFELEGASFRVIGTDGGLLPKPYTTKRLEVAVGQRFDIEVTYDKPGKVTLVNVIPAVDENDVEFEHREPQFVVNVAESDKAPREIVWPEVPVLDRPSNANANITLDVVEGGEFGAQWRINGKSHSTEPLFTFGEGATVKIVLENKAGPEHPFHLHGNFFRIADKKQPGLKDVVLVPGMSKVEITAYMDNPGRWMAHCHNLEHAELGMMSEIVVMPKNGELSPPVGSGHDEH